MLELLFFILAGLVIWLVGGGGGILATPILVYIVHIDPLMAIFYSMMIVGVTSLIGTILARKNVEWKMGFLFGIPSVLATISMRHFGVPALPDTIFGIEKWGLILVMFAVVMFGASCAMLCKNRKTVPQKILPMQTTRLLTMLQGIGVWSLTGLVGAGGGFLIVPALILFGGLESKKALVTSMFIISMNTSIGALGHIPDAVDRWFLFEIIGFSIIGLVIGLFLQKKISGPWLARGFAFFTLAAGVMMLIKELIF